MTDQQEEWLDGAVRDAAQDLGEKAIKEDKRREFLVEKCDYTEDQIDHLIDEDAWG